MAVTALNYLVGTVELVTGEIVVECRSVQGENRVIEPEMILVALCALLAGHPALLGTLPLLVATSLPPGALVALLTHWSAARLPAWILETLDAGESP